MKHRLFLTTIGCITQASIATAAAKDIDLKAVCIDSKAAPSKVINAAINLDRPSAEVWDANGDGTDSLQEKAQAILDPTYCNGANTARCSEGDAVKLDNIRTFLITFLQDTDHVQIVTLARPSNEDIRLWPMLGQQLPGSPESYARLFDDRGRFAAIQCTAPAGPAPSTTTGNPPVWSFERSLRISQTVDGLNLARGGKEKLADVPQAEISYVDDRIAKTATFNIAAVIGLELKTAPNASLIPFASISRRRGRDTTSGVAVSSGNISQWAFGGSYNQTFNSLDRVSLSALYTLDDLDKSRVGSARFSWVPGFLTRVDPLPFGGARHVGPFWVKLNAEIDAQAGYVFKAGTNPDLTSDKGYLRAGPQGKITLWPAVKGGVLSHLSADASAKKLFKLAGPESVYWLDFGVNYNFDTAGHWSLRYSYERGLDDETLKETNQWKLSLGVRY